MKHPLLRLCRLYATSPGILWLTIVCILLAAVLGLAVPWLLKNALDSGLAQGNPRVFVLIGGMLIGVTLVRGVAMYGQSYFAAALAQRLAYRLRNMLYDKIQRLSFTYHDRAQTGDLMSRATADVEAVRLFFHFGLPSVVSLVVTVGGTILALAWLDWRFASLALASLPFFVGLAWGIGRRLRPLQQLVQECTGRLTVILQESLAGIRVVKAFAREPAQTAAFSQEAEVLYQATLRVAQMQALNFPLLTLFLALGLAFTLLLGGQQVIGGAFSLGTLVAATSYLAQLAQPLRRLSWLTGMASSCQAGSTRLFEVLDTVSAVQESPQAVPLPPVQGTLCFEHVSFHYDQAIPVLYDVSFRAEPGDVVALLGSTGSGKSTIAQLIPRFYDVTAGRIALDGFDLRDVQLASLRRQIGLVMQDAWLFSATIRENIIYGCDHVDEAAMIAAARAARAHDFIMEFPDGYDTWVGERGVTLSGGQRQRLAIARAFVRDPRVLILDDATSSVDMETEFLIQQALASLMVGRTTIVIAHRLRTLKHAQQILVLDQGRIVQRGTHTTLVSQPGLYRRLYDLQLRDQEDAGWSRLTTNGHRQTAPASTSRPGWTPL